MNTKINTETQLDIDLRLPFFLLSLTNKNNTIHQRTIM